MDDWREDAEVVRARQAVGDVQATVQALEADLRAAVLNVRSAEAALEAAESVAARGEGLHQVIAARSALLQARAEVEALEAGAVASYGELQAAKQALQVATDAARRACWGPALHEYVAVAGELQAALAAAVDAEERVVALHHSLFEQYGVDGSWLQAPSGGRVGNASYASRKLARQSFESWQAWLTSANIVPAQVRARKLAAGLRGLASS